jgi:hypothetical protein
MADQLSLRGGTTAEHATFTGANKEVTVDTTKKTLVVNDGATVGGHPLMRENASNSALALGSAGTPSLKFTGDTNTGIYSPGADQLAVATNGTGRLFVSAGGNIGVQVTPNTFWGSDYPSLQIGKAAVLFGRNAVNDQTTLANNIFVNSANQNVRLETGTAHAYRMDSGGHIWYTAASGTGSTAATLQEYMRLDSSGRLGIGTSSPSQLLTTVGNIKIAGAQAGNIAKLCLTRTDTSWSINNETDLRFYYGNSDTDSPSTLPVTFTSTGRVGIGTTSPGTKLVVQDTTTSCYLNVIGASAGNAGITFGDSSANQDAGILFNNDEGALRFFKSGFTEAARIDSSGRLLVGTSTGYGVASSGLARFQVGSTAAELHASLTDWSNLNQGGVLAFGAARGGAFGDYTVVQNGDNLGSIRFAGADGTDLQSQGASIAAQVDGTPGANDMPGRLTFSTTADGASSPTERMRLNSSGQLLVGTSTARGLFTASSNSGTTNAVTLVGSASGSVGNGGTLEITNFFTSVTALYFGTLSVTVTGTANTNNITRMYAIRRCSNGGSNDQSSVVALTSANASTVGQGGDMTDIAVTITGSNVENLTVTVTTSATATRTFHAVFHGVAT